MTLSYFIACACVGVAIGGAAFGDWTLSFIMSVVGTTAYWIHEWLRGGDP